MKYIMLILISLFVSACGDVSVSTTSDGGSANTPEPVVVQPVVVE